jgi:ParB-like chromosome segregation protein Spo0J
MENQIQKVPIESLVAHPDNPNRMSGKVFSKLVRNIERTGRYEPIVVRPCPATNCHSCENPLGDALRRRNPDIGENTGCDCFQIINGHHRVKALEQLGKKIADVVVWDVDDKEADILLATLNRLGGSDVLEKKLALLKRLNKQIESRKLAKLLPQTVTQINRLVNLKRPTMPAKLNRRSLTKPLVFF